jgi:inosine-uridine nucleoside N-ribohydrolase
VAALFAIDPQIPRLLKGLVLMCGRFSNKIGGWNPAEWNAWCDPHAAAIVYGAKVALHRSYGLDVTTQVRMKSAEVRKRFNCTMLRPVLDFAKVWFEHSEHITFHDPLAAASIFDESICSCSKGKVEVMYMDGPVAGYTHFTQDKKGMHEVALEVNAPKFFKHYFSVFK